MTRDEGDRRVDPRGLVLLLAPVHAWLLQPVLVLGRLCRRYGIVNCVRVSVLCQAQGLNLSSLKVKLICVELLAYHDPGAHANAHALSPLWTLGSNFEPTSHRGHRKAHGHAVACRFSIH